MISVTSRSFRHVIASEAKQSARFLALLGMTLRLGSGQAFRVRLLSLP